MGLLTVFNFKRLIDSLNQKKVFVTMSTISSILIVFGCAILGGTLITARYRDNDRGTYPI